MLITLIKRLPQSINLYNIKKIKFIKFSVVGAITSTTGLTLNFIFLKIVGTELYITYTAIYASMIALSYLLNSNLTYKKKISAKGKGAYFIIYITSYLIAIGLLRGYDYVFNFEQWVYPFMIFPVTLTFNFAMASLLFLKAPK